MSWGNVSSWAGAGGASLPLSIANGGTGSTTAAAARTALGLDPVTGSTANVSNVPQAGSGWGRGTNAQVPQVLVDGERTYTTTAAVTANQTLANSINAMDINTTRAFIFDIMGVDMVGTGQCKYVLTVLARRGASGDAIIVEQDVTKFGGLTAFGFGTLAAAAETDVNAFITGLTGTVRSRGTPLLATLMHWSVVEQSVGLS